MIEEYITGLIHQALKVDLIEPEDQIFTRNQVLGLLEIETFPERKVSAHMDSIPNLLEKIIMYAVKHGTVQNTLSAKEILAANIMNCFMPKPSAVNSVFNQKYNEEPKKATDYFYNLSKNSNYIQLNRIAKNISYKVNTQYGQMDITINLSKPEKEPEQIKREGEFKNSSNYPKCLLCMENEGYIGRADHPARANHRIIRIPLKENNWYLQYSPYLYYNEHCILFSEDHRPMKIHRRTFENILHFTAKFPHYFIGSNADLPIVGGSILSHDHYQGGNYEFAMTRAKEDFSFKLKNYPEIHASVLHWPMSVIRLRAENIDVLVEACEDILQTWKGYSDELAQIMAYTEDTPHNTITPIARNRDGMYEIDLVLRNNRTTKEHPLGIFHPHEDVHHIKKENIGLIEVMGLAVLPPRLKGELVEIQAFLLGKVQQVAAKHSVWAKKLKATYEHLTNEEQVNYILFEELGKKFVKCLKDSGVFKEKEAFERFINTLNK